LTLFGLKLWESVQAVDEIVDKE